MVSLSLIPRAIAFLVLISRVDAQRQSDFERQLRGYCRSQNLGNGCDQDDVDRLCQNPRLTWVCKRQNQRKDEGENGTATTAAPVTRTRRPRRKYTTRPTQAPVTERSQPTKSPISKKFILTPEQASTIQGNCAKKSGGCQAQSAKAASTKKQTTNAIVQDLIKGKKAASEAEAVQKAQEILDAVQEAKRALYDVQGLSGIEPEDDGLWHKDMRLTLEQAQFIQREVTGVNGLPTAIPRQVTRGRDKRFSIYMESFPTSKWNLPIGYVLGSDLTYDQASQVRAAVAEIQRKTCIRFYEDRNYPPTTPYILYQAYYSGGYCGQSPVGNQGGVNTVWLNFNCDGGRLKATIIHETMHSLGVHHEHVRVDRDDWITVDWNNIDPQSYDLFDGRPYVNSYTSYGVPYDYYSVMHYHAYVASLNGGVDMIPKYYPDVLTRVIGQRRGMSDRDAEKLRKMYCEPDCTDYHVWCGYWATQKYCLDMQYYSYMKSTCGKSCGFCPDSANA